MALISHLNPIRRYGIGGTDLLIPFLMPDGRTGYIGGDSFKGDRPRVGGGEWYSPIVLIADRPDVRRPIVFDDAMQGGRQIIPYQHNNPEFSTVLPCDAISIGSRIYMWVMFTAGLGNERYCKIIHTDDLGEHWDQSGPRWDTRAWGGRRVMISWERGGDGYVYVISTGGLARDKNMLLWRVLEQKIADERHWQGWGWNGTDWGWGRPPTEILPRGTKLGEICLRKVQGNWIMSGFDAGAYNIFVKVGASILADWTKAPDYRPVKGAPHVQGGPDVVPQLYGGYIDPRSTFEPYAMAAIVSEWNTRNNEPYRGSQYRIDGIKPVVTPTVETETSGKGASNQEWDMATAKEVLSTVDGKLAAGKDYDNGREDGHNDGDRNLFGAVHRSLWELTLWLKELSLDDLEAHKDKAQTVLGHARRASSWGRHTFAKLTDVGFGVLDCQVKLDKVLHNQKILAEKLGVDMSQIQE